MFPVSQSWSPPILLMSMLNISVCVCVCVVRMIEMTI